MTTFSESKIDPTVLVRSESRAHPSDAPVWLREFFGGGTTSAGVAVSEHTALSASSVFACVRNIAEDLAKLPLLTYRREGAGKARYPEHPVYDLLHRNPNPEMTAFDFRQALTASAVLWGGGFAEIELSGMGIPYALWPIEPWRMRVERDRSTRALVYIVDGTTRLSANDVIHIKGFSFTGIVGLMVAQVGRDALGLTLAAQKFAASFFANGMNISGILEHPGELSDTAMRHMRESLDEIHAGPDRANRPLILEDGTRFTKIGATPNEAQMLETRQFQIEDVARWFRMPPHKIQHLARSTFSNIEHQAIEYVVDTLLPWATRWEQEVGKKLIAERDVFAEHLLAGLLRGDTLARTQSLQIQRQNGIINADEWRAIENMNPLPDGQGEKYIVPLNMRDQADEPDDGDDKSDELDARMVRALKVSAIDAARRVSRRESELFKKPKDESREAHREYVRKTVEPIALGFFNEERAAKEIADAYCLTEGVRSMNLESIEDNSRRLVEMIVNWRP